MMEVDYARIHVELCSCQGILLRPISPELLLIHKMKFEHNKFTTLLICGVHSNI